VGTSLSAPAQAVLGTHPASYVMGSVSFTGVRWLGQGVDHRPPSSEEAKERVELYVGILYLGIRGLF